MLAKFSIRIMAISSTARTGLRGDFLRFRRKGAVLLHHGHPEDSCRYRYDGVADDHHDRSQHLSQDRRGSNVSIADGGHCDNGPVDAAWNAGETVGRPLHQVITR